MKKLIGTILCILVCATALVGCGSNTAEKQDQTIYIGDNSKVVEVVSELQYPEGMSYDHIEIQSEQEPYELRVFVTVDGINTEGLEECADKAFDEISNMGIISFYNNADDELIRTFDRE